jgi:hypothetical protein
MKVCRLPETKYLCSDNTSKYLELKLLRTICFDYQDLIGGRKDNWSWKKIAIRKKLKILWIFLIVCPLSSIFKRHNFGFNIQANPASKSENLWASSGTITVAKFANQNRFTAYGQQSEQKQGKGKGQGQGKGKGKNNRAWKTAPERRLGTETKKIIEASIRAFAMENSTSVWLGE